MKGTLIKKENNYYFWSSDWNPEKNKGFVANSEGTVERKLSIKNCEAIANGYDLDEIASQKYLIENTGAMFMPNQHEVNNIFRQEGFKEGFQKALEILGDKKFSETELYRAFLINSAGDDFTLNQFFNKTVLPMFQETEWDVEIVTELAYTVNENSETEMMPEPHIKLDSEGNLILKIK